MNDFHYFKIFFIVRILWRFLVRLKISLQSNKLLIYADTKHALSKHEWSTVGCITDLIVPIRTVQDLQLLNQKFTVLIIFQNRWRRTNKELKIIDYNKKSSQNYPHQHRKTRQKRKNQKNLFQKDNKNKSKKSLPKSRPKRKYILKVKVKQRPKVAQIKNEIKRQKNEIKR